MNAGTGIEIHEFSTGIQVGETADGRWFSRGFTGQYMNATCEVPQAIERAIRNDEFAVTEGAYSEQPALIGRVVPDEEHQANWSVVAIVSKGIDNFGRSTSLYRYFVCGKPDGIWKILTWIDNYQREEEHLPVFDPFEKQYSPHVWHVPNSPKPPLVEKTETLLQNGAIPIVVPRDHSNQLRIIHEMAERVASETEQPVSWAVNVEALKKPHRFLVVYPASDRAYANLQQAKRTTPEALLPLVADEQSIKKAIQNLTSSQTIKLDAVQILAKALTNNRITREYWLSWFNSQGANKMQNFRSEAANRLLALRAMVVPETLPDYLLWLANSPKDAEDLEISLRFQHEINAKLLQHMEPQQFQEYFQARLVTGIESAVPAILLSKVTPDWFARLLLEESSAWSSQREAFVKGICSNLELLQGYYSQGVQAKQSKSEQLQYGKEFWSGIKVYWQTKRHKPKRSEYIPFAELFKALGNYRLASYFYQVSKGKVPNDVFIKAFPSARMRSSTSFFGLTLYRDVPIHEQLLTALVDLCNNLSNISMQVKTPLDLTLLIALFSFFLGMVTGDRFGVENSRRLFGTSPTPPSTNSSDTSSRGEENSPGTQLSPSSSADASPSPTSSASPSISQEASQPPIPDSLKADAIANFGETQRALNQIIQDLQDNGFSKDVEIKQELKYILGLEDGINLSEVLQHDFSSEVSQDGNPDAQKLIRDRDTLIQAIYSFQARHSDNRLQQKGYILLNGGGTVVVLKNLIRQNLSGGGDRG